MNDPRPPLPDLPELPPGIYAHADGGRYRLVLVAYFHADKAPAVVYAPEGGPNPGRPFVTTLTRWQERFRLVEGGE